MQRRQLIQGLAALGLFGPGASTAQREGAAVPEAQPPYNLSRSQWRARLSPAAYHVLFEHGTERAGTSPLNHEKRPGRYHCAACYLPLFDAATKYDSGTGWPSFWQALPGALGTSRDFKLILPRTEYHCIRCKGHQGHVFNDGPPPTGLRYCNNGVALIFVPEGEAPPVWEPPS
jgi:peptide-methionine (R)-S-oxide reductase